MTVHPIAALTAAEHRATRAEAQSAIRGRAVVIYRERAREAEARIKAAIAIHAEDDGHCTYCKHPDGTGEYATPAWPCPTVTALTTETP